jgi:putative oxidoreductase
MRLVYRSGNDRWARPALVARLLTGVIFVVFGLGKFTAHATEAASFHRYGLPSPSAFVYAVGVLEIVGGLLLIAGFAVRPVALGLGGNMVGAITTAGRIDGGAINLALRARAARDHARAGLGRSGRALARRSHRGTAHPG